MPLSSCSPHPSSVCIPTFPGRREDSTRRDSAATRPVYAHTAVCSTNATFRSSGRKCRTLRPLIQTARVLTEPALCPLSPPASPAALVPEAEPGEPEAEPRISTTLTSRRTPELKNMADEIARHIRSVRPLCRSSSGKSPRGSAARHGRMKVLVGCAFSCSQKNCFCCCSRQVSLRPDRAVDADAIFPLMAHPDLTKRGSGSTRASPPRETISTFLCGRKNKRKEILIWRGLPKYRTVRMDEILLVPTRDSMHNLFASGCSRGIRRKHEQSRIARARTHARKPLRNASHEADSDGHRGPGPRGRRTPSAARGDEGATPLCCEKREEGDSATGGKWRTLCARVKRATVRTTPRAHGPALVVHSAGLLPRSVLVGVDCNKKVSGPAREESG